MTNNEPVLNEKEIAPKRKKRMNTTKSNKNMKATKSRKQSKQQNSKKIHSKSPKKKKRRTKRNKSKKMISSKLMVNGLPPTMNEKELNVLFSPYGDILRCKISFDIVTGNSLCFGFVEYKNKMDAHSALIAMNGYMINDKVLTVSFALKTTQYIEPESLCNDVQNVPEPPSPSTSFVSSNIDDVLYHVFDLNEETKSMNNDLKQSYESPTNSFLSSNNGDIQYQDQYQPQPQSQPINGLKEQFQPQIMAQIMPQNVNNYNVPIVLVPAHIANILKNYHQNVLPVPFTPIIPNNLNWIEPNQKNYFYPQ